MIAGTASGVGKTSVAVGLMAALAKAKYKVGAAKVGPDYIDPGYHKMATGRASYNLDPFMTGRLGVAESFRRAATGTDICVVEGVMGLYDGTDRAGLDDFEINTDPSNPQELGGRYSSYEVATALGIGVVLVMDARSSSHSLAATAHGFTSLAHGSPILGVIVNRVRSDRHSSLVHDAMESLGIEILGTIADGVFPNFESRQLGLIPTEERLEEARIEIARLAELVNSAIDIETLVSKLRTVELAQAPIRDHSSESKISIAVARGPAFSFVYQENLDILQEMGAELHSFDPATDPMPAGAKALILGGGFPELYMDEINANMVQLESIATNHRLGMPIWAECGGLMLLAQTIDAKKGLGILDVNTKMGSRLNLGYQRAISQRSNLLVGAGSAIYGHEFHYSIPDNRGDLLRYTYSPNTLNGFGSDVLYASYLHLHLGQQPEMASRFLDRARTFKFGL